MSRPVVTFRSLPKTISAARLRKLERSKLELRNLQLSLATLQRKVTSMEEKLRVEAEEIALALAEGARVEEE
jgi:hypothetical protein